MGRLQTGEKKIEYVKIAKKTAKKRGDLIFTGLTFISATLLIVFAIVPTFKTVQEISKEIRQKKQISTALKTKLEALTSLDGQYERYKATFDDMTLIYPAEDNYCLLLGNIDTIVARNNLILSSVNFSEYKKTEYSLSTTVLEPTTLRISVKGDQGSLIPLLRDIEGLPMFPIVEGVSYSTKPDEDGNLNFSISVRIYGVGEINYYD